MAKQFKHSNFSVASCNIIFELVMQDSNVFKHVLDARNSYDASKHDAPTHPYRLLACSVWNLGRITVALNFSDCY